MSKQAFIDNLFTKRATYTDPDQAEMAANMLETLSSDIYTESQRFVFELIQNADDAAHDAGNDRGHHRLRLGGGDPPTQALGGELGDASGCAAHSANASGGGQAQTRLRSP